MKRIAILGEFREAIKIREGLTKIGRPLLIDIFNDEEKFLKEYEKGYFEITILTRGSILNESIELLKIPERIKKKRTSGKIIYLGRFKAEREEALKSGVDVFIDMDDPSLFERIGRALDKPRLAVNSWHYYHVLKDQWVNIILFSSVIGDRDVLVSFKPHIILISSERVSESELDGILEIRNALPYSEVILIHELEREEFGAEALRHGFTDVYDEREGQEAIKEKIINKLNRKWMDEINMEVKREDA